MAVRIWILLPFVSKKIGNYVEPALFSPWNTGSMGRAHLCPQKWNRNKGHCDLNIRGDHSDESAKYFLASCVFN
jgi:hypothetical protein